MVVSSLGDNSESRCRSNPDRGRQTENPDRAARGSVNARSGGSWGGEYPWNANGQIYKLGNPSNIRGLAGHSQTTDPIVYSWFFLGNNRCFYRETRRPGFALKKKFFSPQRQSAKAKQSANCLYFLMSHVPIAESTWVGRSGQLLSVAGRGLGRSGRRKYRRVE